MEKKSKIIAHGPWSVELTKRRTQNSLVIDVELEGRKAGSLRIGRGSVEWWPSYKKVKAHRFNWWDFIDRLEAKPERRAKR